MARSTIDHEFQNLHEFIKAANLKLNRFIWDYLIGGAETETTVKRNRAALDSLAFRPRALVDGRQRIAHEGKLGGSRGLSRNRRVEEMPGGGQHVTRIAGDADKFCRRE